MRNRPRPLLKDVAARAEVSLTTVSIVLNGKAGTNIPPDTQARVMTAAAELGYRPNAMARSLRRQRSDTIAVISDEIATTPFAGAMLQGAQDAAWAAGIVILLVNTGRDREMEARAIEIMLGRQVDAIVYATMSHRVVTPPTALRDIRAVLLGARTADASLPSVVPDEVGGARSAVETLVEHGHRRIGWVTTAEPGPATFGRLAGYRSMLEEHGLPFDPSLVSAGTAGDTHSGVDAAGRLLDRSDRPTALFCFNDRIAMGAYRAIRVRGLRVPDDISVVGFDNMEQIAPWLDPPLTTMQLPHYEMGRWAVEHVLRDPAVEGDGETPPQCSLPCPRIERASVAAPQPVA
jgi:LacI family transcriptional regulator